MKRNILKSPKMDKLQEVAFALNNAFCLAISADCPVAKDIG